MKQKEYSEYRSAKKIWLGELPSHWEVKRIKHTTYVKGRIGWQGLKTDEFIDEGPYLVTGTDFVNGRINWNTCYHVSEERYNEDPFIQLRDNDLLITKDGTIGKVAIVKELRGKATLNSGVFVTRPTTDDYLTEYLYWVLNSNIFTDFIDYSKTGTTISHLYQNVFVEFAFPVPTFGEQRTITSYLDRETNRIDTLISKKQRQIELLQERRAALISSAVTKGLDPSVKMKNSGIEWLGEIPGHWKTKRLKFLTRKINDGTHVTPTYVDEGIPFLRVTDIHTGKINFSLVKRIPAKEHQELSKRCRPEKYDLLLSKNGTIGIPCVITWDQEFSIFVSLCLIKVKKELDVFYAKYFFLSNEISEQIYSGSKRSTVTNLHLDKIKEFFFAVPPIDEQRSIVNFLDQEVKIINKMIEKINNSIKLLHEYRKALISVAVTGKIDVRNTA